MDIITIPSPLTFANRLAVTVGPDVGVGDADGVDIGAAWVLMSVIP